MVQKKKFAEKLMTDRCDPVRQYLIEIREALNLSASEVAKSLGWQIYRLWRIENGAGISLEDAADIADKYGIDVNELSALVAPHEAVCGLGASGCGTHEVHARMNPKRTKPVFRPGRHRSKNGTTRGSVRERS